MGLDPLSLSQAGLAPTLEVSVGRESQKQIAWIFLPPDSALCAPGPTDTDLSPSRCRRL